MQEHLAIKMFEDVFESSTVSGVARPLVVQYHMQLDPFLVPNATRYQMLMTMTSRPGGWVVSCQWLHCMRATSGLSACCKQLQTVQHASPAAQRSHGKCSLQPWPSWNTKENRHHAKCSCSWTDSCASA